MNRRHFAVCVAVVASGSFANAAPPPPPSPTAVRISHQLAEAYGQRDVGKYLSLLSPELVVSVDGKIVASGKRAYSRRVAEEFPRQVVSYIADSVSFNVILRAEAVDTRGLGSSSGKPQDCCKWARMAAYKIGKDNLIHSIEFVSGQSDWKVKQGR